MFRGFNIFIAFLLEYYVITIREQGHLKIHVHLNSYQRIVENSKSPAKAVVLFIT